MKLSKSELKFLRSLSQKKVREVEKKLLVEGWRAVKDALNSGFTVHFAVVLPKFQENPDYESILTQARDRRVVIKDATAAEMNQISDTVHSQGIVALVEQKHHDFSDVVRKGAKLLVIAEAVSDPGNMGSIIRTCDWFGVDGLVVSEGSVEVHNEKVVRSSAGSIFHLPIVEGPQLLKILPELKARGFFIAATAGDGDLFFNRLKSNSKMALILGSEARGISEDVRRMSDAIVKIPKVGRAESLNVGVACGIILAHLKSQGSHL